MYSANQNFKHFTPCDIFSLFSSVVLDNFQYQYIYVTDDGEKKKRGCECEPCQVKNHHLQSKEPWRQTRRKAMYVFSIMWPIVNA